MTWIDDAQKQAKQRKMKNYTQKGIFGRIKAITDNTSTEGGSRQNWKPLLSATKQTKAEIELVLQRAQQEGLIVKYLGVIRTIKTENSGNFLEETVAEYSGDGFYDPVTESTYTYVWAHQWSVYYPELNRYTAVSLGTVKFLFWLQPSTTPQAVEQGIKNWLVEIFSQ